VAGDIADILALLDSPGSVTAAAGHPALLSSMRCASVVLRRCRFASLVGCAGGVELVRALEAACDDRFMSEDDADRNSFEDVARVLADEVSRAVERLSQVDVEEIARAAGAEAERARRWMDELGRWLREQGDALGNAPFATGRTEDPLRHAGPHPLDLPSADQGLALAALDSGRWRVEPGTSALAVHGEGPGPSDALGLARELRVRDWVTAEGALTLAGRAALSRWLDAGDRA
jgi:hypothetical protein